MNPNIYQPLLVPSDEEIGKILVKRIDQQKQAVGIVVGVIEPAGRRVVAYGNLTNGDPRTLDGDTIFEIGSVTKVFTSLLFADMVNRREVSLDDPAAKYLPENVKVPERSGKLITLQDLSTHTSGLPFLPGNFKPKDYTVDDLYQFLSGYELLRDPGSEFEYSNLGAGLLGHLLANRAGSEFERLIGTRITQQLNMPDTGITLSASMQERMATGHNGLLAPAANRDLPTLAGAGALRSSANDMLTFLEAFLGYRETPLAPAMRAMFEFRRPALKAEVGLGCFFNSVEGKEIAWHNGRTAGFQSVVGFDLEMRTGVVVLANASTPTGVDDIGGHLLNPKVALADPEPPRQRIEIPIDPKLFDHYTGRYQATPNLIFEITRDGDHLFAQSSIQLPDKHLGNLTGMPKFELFAEGENTFFAKVADNQVTFEASPDGRVARLIMHRAGRDMPPAARLP